MCTMFAPSGLIRERAACPAALQGSSVTNHLKHSNAPFKTNVAKCSCVSQDWPLLVWVWNSNQFSVASPVGLVRVPFLKDVKVNANQPVLFGSPASPAFDVWIRVIPRLQYVWVVFLTPLCCACCNVKYCQTGVHNRISAGLEPFLSASVSQTWLAAMCSECA